MVLNTKTRITADEYYQLPEYAEHDFIELINGEVVIPMPPRTKHQSVIGDIFFLLKTFSKIHGGSAYIAPTEVYFDADNIYEPDALYLTPDTKTPSTNMLRCVYCATANLNCSARTIPVTPLNQPC